MSEILAHQITVGDLLVVGLVLAVWGAVRFLSAVLVAERSTDGGEERRRIEAQDAVIRAQAQADRAARP